MSNITPSLKLPQISNNQPVFESNVTTVGGVKIVKWDNSKAFTPVGQLLFFSQFLAAGNQFNNFVESCPLFFKSNNAPEKKDVLGSLLLSIIMGFDRYSHIGQIYGDNVSASVLGLNQICSSDSVRRAIKKIDEVAGLKWINECLLESYLELLSCSWILDIDATVKNLYGKQEEATIGYNPRHPGRPSHNYHSFFIANIRIILGLEVRAGNEHSGSFGLDELFRFIDRLPKEKHPCMIRGDVSYGSDKMMLECESRFIDYIFKLRLSKNVKALIQKVESANGKWESAGNGWQGCKSKLKLQGWKKERNVVVLRYQDKKPQKQEIKEIGHETGAVQLLFPELFQEEECSWKYSVLVTSQNDSILTLAQRYRDRGDCENVYDEMKNQWGWSGFVTQDISSTRIVASIVALVVNWWNIYSRLAMDDKHIEAKTSRSLLLHAVGEMTSHSGQTTLRISSSHNYVEKIVKVTSYISNFLSDLTAKQLDFKANWVMILRRAYWRFFGNLGNLPPDLISTG